ncbi:hypothetical protein OJJOAM_004369 [Cupriavidus sp. H18C1]
MPRRLARSVSFMRRIGRPVRSACICSSASLPDSPPPTSRLDTSTPAMSRFASMQELTECAMPSRMA